MVMNVHNGKEQAKGFIHDAMFYRDMSEFLSGVLEFVQAGLDLGEPVLVAAPGEKLDLLRGDLGPAAALVTFVDMSRAGRNPTRIIPDVLSAFIDDHDGQRVRLVGEPIWAGRTPEEYVAAVQHEALINLAFEDREATILCPYDMTSLDVRAVQDAMRTHPTVASLGGGRWNSVFYADPRQFAVDCLGHLPPPAATAQTLIFSGTELSGVRRLVVEEASAIGLAADRVRDLRLAVNEIATNTVAYSGGPGTLRIWQEDERIVCEIQDRGTISDPLAGRHPVRTGAERGRGLLLANKVCDLVQINASRSATTIRLYMRLAAVG